MNNIKIKNETKFVKFINKGEDIYKLNIKDTNNLYLKKNLPLIGLSNQNSFMSEFNSFFKEKYLCNENNNLKSEYFSSSRINCKLPHQRNQTFTLKSNQQLQYSLNNVSNYQIPNSKEKSLNCNFGPLKYTQIKQRKNYKFLVSNHELNPNIKNRLKILSKCINIKDKNEILQNIKALKRNKRQEFKK